MSSENLIPTVDVLCPPCCVCGEQAVVTVTKDGLEAWRGGAYVQRAFPEMKPDQRELLVSGTHPKCWDELFPPESR